MTSQYYPHLERQNELQINRLYAVYYVNPILNNNQYFQKENIFLAERSSISQRQRNFPSQTQSRYQIAELTQRHNNLNQESFHSENFVGGLLFNNQSYLPSFQLQCLNLYTIPVDYLAAFFRFQQNASYQNNESFLQMINDEKIPKYPTYKNQQAQKVTAEDNAQPLEKENCKKDKKTLNFCFEIRDLTRQQRVKRYLIKKDKRRFCKRILYTSRKFIADHRERLRGKFAPKKIKFQQRTDILSFNKLL